ncbi:MAG: pyridoxal-dependent decarboxylase (plasmid) [Microcoleus anatoxicus]|uniref:pyridoxal phosphate-dependent decarboxylase family protein n=1 Tax=Microcoleus anatoxicus TaxID=2705319 RepID=UPI00366FC4BE
MNTPRDAQSQGFEKARRNLQELSRSSNLPKLDNTSGTRSLEAWFMGPKGENADILEILIVEAIRDQAEWRNNYHPEDPKHITDEIKQSPEYLQAMDNFNEGYHSLLEFLKKSVPFFSMRYQGHMNWDLTMPSVVGYFAAMLYNPNNVAFEASTATTYLEIIVGNDLCLMLGYTIPEDEEEITPWGHITCGGTVANIEALWSARNLKFYPIALQQAVINDLTQAKNIEVSFYEDGILVAKPLIELTVWQLLNLKADDILGLPARLESEYRIDSTVISDAVSKYSLQDLGIQKFAKDFLSDVPEPLFFVPGSKHYSFPKAAALLGMGASHMQDVDVDANGRMKIDVLRAHLDKCLAEKRPVYTVVAVMGSTEEGAVDPLREILDLREEYRKRGLEFTVHADAAWGGYFASILRDDFEMEPLPFRSAPPPISPLSAYVTTQFEALGETDSITVDPHKAGYIPYPAGALCYRNSAMRSLVTFAAPYIFHGEAEPTVGIYGIEGSKPGAACAAVYLSHRVIRPTKSGYGKLLGQALYSCDKFYARLLCMEKPEDSFIVVPLSDLPDGITKQEVRDLIDGKTNEEIQNNPDAMAVLKEIGPDENILVYAFNFKTPSGEVNQDLDKANLLNKLIYEKLSIKPETDISAYDLIVSTTDFEQKSYGIEFIKTYKERLGVIGSSGTSITVLRSVVMDPWVTETASGSFIDVLEKVLRDTVNQVINDNPDDFGL